MAGRFLTPFPSGGEVFAIGRLGRLPLQQMAFAIEPQNGSAWVGLRHIESGTQLVLLPAGAKEGAWMLQLLPKRRIDHPRSSLFCIEREHVYSASAGGYLNLRGEVLLRGHGDGGPPRPPAKRSPSSRIRVKRISAAQCDADREWWECHRQLPAVRSSSNGEARSSAVAGAVPATPSLALPSETTQLSSRVHVLTYATKATPMLCDCLLVALAHGVDLTLLGYGEEYKGNYQKLRGARKHLSALPADALVLFADAYDVLYAGDASALAASYVSLNVSAERVLFMAEKGCWPDWDMAFGRHFCLQRYPPSPTPYRFVNSGVWVGFAPAAHRLLVELEGYTPGLDDQHVTGHIYLDRPEAFELDRRAVMFQSMQEETGHVHLSENGVSNSLTGTQPLVLHFNGGSKPQFNKYRDHLLGRRCVPRDGVVSTSAGPRTYRSICPSHPAPRSARTCP